MATAAYLTGRRKYQRPQAILWSDNAGTLTSGVYVPNGYEVGADVPEGTDPSLIDQFLILSDHNRGEIGFTPQRIEQRQRTINGRMRSYHIADKLSMSVSWNMLPSRGYSRLPNFNSTTGVEGALIEGLPPGAVKLSFGVVGIVKPGPCSIILFSLRHYWRTFRQTLSIARNDTY